MLAIFVKKRINKRLSIVIEVWHSGSHDNCRTQIYKVEGKSSVCLPSSYGRDRHWALLISQRGLCLKGWCSASWRFVKETLDLCIQDTSVGHLQEPTSEVWSLSVSWKECHSRGWVLCNWFWAKALGISGQFIWATLTPSTLNTSTTHPSWYPRLLYQDSRVCVTPKPRPSSCSRNQGWAHSVVV